MHGPLRGVLMAVRRLLRPDALGSVGDLARFVEEDADEVGR